MVAYRRKLQTRRVACALVASACWAAAAAVGAHAAGAGPIVFYANVGNSVPGTSLTPNAPLVRPTTLLEFEDGSWSIVNLRWSSWGGATAAATGISSASDCRPNCAAGKRTHDPAQLVLSQPKAFLGRTVYTCFRLTIPARPQSNQDECLQRSGKIYAYRAAAGSPVHAGSFLSPDRKIWCVLDNLPGSHDAWCGTTASLTTEAPQHSAQVSATGKVLLCDWTARENPLSSCLQNWDVNAQVLKAGQVDVLYSYSCAVETSAVTCTVTSGRGKGDGFRLAETGAAKIAG